MPGSLLLGNDAYSDVSDISGRSLDSKIGGKKVSFNKAVRVKQYPEISSEHLTLPSNRFWFKVYKNKQDSPIYNVGSSAWDDENMDCIHDSLAPIAEVEDQDIDSNSNSLIIAKSISPNRVNNERSNSHNFNNTHPTDPPVDYLDDMLSPGRNFNQVKYVWGSCELDNNRVNNNNNRTNNSFNWNCNGSGYQPEIIMEENLTFLSSQIDHNSRLSRSSFRNDNQTRRSVRNLDTSDHWMLRRSRSHDDHIDSDNRSKQLRKADKSVSTEDLNSNSKHIIPTNRFFKNSRDIATQCYGTLNRNKSPSKRNSSSSSQTESYLSNTERLKNFKSKLSYTDEQNNSSVNSPKKDYALEKFSRPRDNTMINNVSPSTTQNRRLFNHDSQLKGKLSNGNIKPLIRTENSISSILQRQANKTFNKTNSKSESNHTFILAKDTRKNQENTYQINESQNSNTVGCLRGRQIPLNEVNTNTNRKLLNRNNNDTSKSYISRKTDENLNVPMSPNRIVKSNGQVSNGYQSKRSPPNNPERRSSAKSHISSYSEGGDSMIDWSLSGFQLARKPEVTSMSDSEYTVHRRPPLLMYIPGVSHHDRPAIEDDRLSALSDLSRSELNDGSLLGGKNDSGDFRGRQPMREGKSKWLKWKSRS